MAFSITADGPTYITPEEAAARLPFEAEWFRQQLRSGRLRGSKVGGRWVVEEEALTELVEAGSNSPPRRRRRRDISTPA